jgi:type VI secretion system secreted protein VgrG
MSDTTSYTQAARQTAVFTTLPEDTLLLQAFEHVEELGRPSVTILELRSTESGLDPDELLGQSMAVRLDIGDLEEPRWIHGYVWSFEAHGQQGGLWKYRVELRPWIGMLASNREYRVFQEKTAADVVETVLGPYSGAMELERNLYSSDYRVRDMCVQYGESDGAFIQRLLEDDGIYYVFEYAEGSEKLILCDDSTQHAERPGDAVMPYQATGDGGGFVDDEAVLSFTRRSEYRCARYGAVDYSPVRATTYLIELCEGELDHGPSGRQRAGYVDAFPGHQTSADGATYARLRKEEHEAVADVFHGTTVSRQLSPGMQIGLMGHGAHEEDERFLITKIALSASAAPWEPGADTDAALDFSCSFEAIPAERPFRPQRVTPKPKAEMQTAFVVAASEGDETPDVAKDDYCCVRVKFHWDHWMDARHPVGDVENVTDAGSSCWVRTSQAWAGKGWGWVSNPHPGQELIIDFVNGDPDRPIAVGRVYNEESRPAISPSQNKQVMQLRDSGSNHIAMGGSTGTESIEMYSPKGTTRIRIGGIMPPA